MSSVIASCCIIIKKKTFLCSFCPLNSKPLEKCWKVDSVIVIKSRLGNFFEHPWEEPFNNSQIFSEAMFEWLTLWQTWRWHCYADVHPHNLFPFFLVPNPRLLVLAQCAAVSDSFCWHMRVRRERRVCACRKRDRKDWEEKKCTWINDVLEQVHKWEGPMFVSKDNAVLIGELWAQFKCLGYTFVPLLALHTHTLTYAGTRIHAMYDWYHAGKFSYYLSICVLFLSAGSWILTWRGSSPLCPAHVQVPRRWLQATNEY